MGRRGSDVIVEVPPGITVIDKESNQAIAELNKEEETLLVARGGKKLTFKF